MYIKSLFLLALVSKVSMFFIFFYQSISHKIFKGFPSDVSLTVEEDWLAHDKVYIYIYIDCIYNM